MPRVILYKGTFAYDLAGVFVEELAAGFAALGREVVLVDLSDRAGRGARIQEELARPFECVVAINAIGSRPRDAAPGTHVYDRLTAPYVAVLIDHPSCHLARCTIENMIVTCYDRTHVAFAEKYFGGAKRVVFLPHGGSSAGGGDAGDRDMDVLFPGTYADPDAAYAALRAGVSDDVFDILDFVVERLLAADCEPMEDALAAVLAAEARDGEWRTLCARLPVVESFVKSYKRMEVLRRLDRAQIAVEILGNHWPPDLFRHHRIRPPLPYREALRLMQRAKIVLNLGFVPDGSHERVFSTALNGALPASDYNPYLDDLFAGERGALLFRWREIEGVAEKFARALQDGTALRERTAAAQEAARSHTWAARAAALIGIVAGTSRA